MGRHMKVLRVEDVSIHLSTPNVVSRSIDSYTVEIRDYNNGTGRWSRREIEQRYAKYVTECGCESWDIAPQEITHGEVRWIYPVMYPIIEGMKADNPACVQIGIEFIEENAKFPFGKSLKAGSARALRRTSLTEQQKDRIRRRVFGLLAAGHIPHEFRDYARLVRRIGFKRADVPNPISDDPYVKHFVAYFQAAAETG